MRIDTMEVCNERDTKDVTVLDTDKMRHKQICALELEEIVGTVMDSLGDLSDRFGVEFYVDVQFVKNKDRINNTIHVNAWGDTKSEAICTDCVKED